MIPGYRYLVRVSLLHADIEASEWWDPQYTRSVSLPLGKKCIGRGETSYWTWGAHGGDVAVSHWVSINSAEHVRTKRYDTDSNAPVGFCYPVLFFLYTSSIHVTSPFGTHSPTK
jgi:hypothetical protein